MKINYLKINQLSTKNFLIITSVFLFASCGNTRENTTNNETNNNQNEEKTIVELTPEQYKMAGIEIGKIEKKILSNTLKVSGTIEAPPQNLITISAPFGGFIHNTDLLQGMKVKKGQVLAILQHPDYIQLQQDYLDKKNKLLFLEKEYQRQKDLYHEKVSSEKTFQQIEADYKSMKAQVKGLEEKLSMIGIDVTHFTENDISGKITIRSPVNGYVSAINVNIGKYVNPNDVMFEIVNTEHLHIELMVYEKDVMKVKIGQKIMVKLPGEEKGRLAKVYLIGRKITNDRAVSVHAHLEKEDTELLPGTRVFAWIELNNNEVNAVPDEAVVAYGGKYYVYVLKERQKDNYIFEMMEIEKGVSENNYCEIIFNRNMNIDTIQIVTKGAYALLSKMKNIIEEDE